VASLRPILTVTVFVDGERNVVAQATRHGIDAAELWAAGGFLALNMGVTVAQLLNSRPRPHEAPGLVQRGHGSVADGEAGGNLPPNGE
jgi:hypothetical protein